MKESSHCSKNELLSTFGLLKGSVDHKPNFHNQELDRKHTPQRNHTGAIPETTSLKSPRKFLTSWQNFKSVHLSLQTRWIQRLFGRRTNSNQLIAERCHQSTQQNNFRVNPWKSRIWAKRKCRDLKCVSLHFTNLCCRGPSWKTSWHWPCRHRECALFVVAAPSISITHTFSLRYRSLDPSGEPTDFATALQKMETFWLLSVFCFQEFLKLSRRQN